MTIIGLTGNIACGKTTVATLLKTLGADRVIDADLIAHEVLEQPEVKTEVVGSFGPEMLSQDGHVDRQKLGSLVFSSPVNLRRLEKIVHPLVVKRIEGEAADWPSDRVMVIDAVKLIEAGLDRICDEVWLVRSKPEQELERLISQGMALEEAASRIAAQATLGPRLQKVKVVIDNSGSLEKTRQQVEREWRRLTG